MFSNFEARAHFFLPTPPCRTSLLQLLKRSRKFNKIRILDTTKKTRDWGTLSFRYFESSPGHISNFRPNAYFRCTDPYTFFFSLLKLQPGTMSQNSSLLLLKYCPHQASTLQITLASTFFFAKEKSALGRKDSDSSTSAKVGGAGLGRDHHEWGQWKEEGSERLEGEAATGEGPPRMGAWKSPWRACQVAGGPGRRPSEGHVARAGRCHRAPRRPGRGRGAPRRGSGARGRTLPTSAAARLSPKLGFEPPPSPDVQARH